MYIYLYHADKVHVMSALTRKCLEDLAILHHAWRKGCQDALYTRAT